MKRSFVKAIAAGALAVLVGTGAAASAYAAPSTTWVAPEVNWTGADTDPWTTTPTNKMFTTDKMVPGDSVAAGVWVRNGGDRKAHLVVALSDVQIPEARQKVLDEIAALPEGAALSKEQRAVKGLYEEVKLRTDLGEKSVNDFIPALVKAGGDIILFEGDVEPGQKVAVAAWYDWLYGDALDGVSEAGNGSPGSWMDFKLVSSMFYVDEPTVPPTSTSAPPSTDPIDVGGKSTSRAPEVPGPGNPGQPGGGSLPSTGVSGPVLGLALTALVLLSLGVPLVMRKRPRRTHS